MQSIPCAFPQIRLLQFKLLFGLLLLACSGPLFADRIKDMGQFQGVRSNQLTGYGIVVGLAGTGDDSLDYSTLGLKGTVSRFGLTLPPGVNPALKNAAAVLITADLPPFAKPGHRLDITVSALGKAKSLRGGTLILAPLHGADGQIYAMAQGNLVVGGLGVDSADGSKVSVNIPSAGRIDGGATVERSVDSGFLAGERLTFNLAQNDMTNVRLVTEAINQALGQGTATSLDGASVEIAAPQGAQARVQLMSQIENLQVAPTEAPARVIVNARTGTVVINGSVRIGPAAVSHGKLTIKVDEKPKVIQPAPFSRGQTAVEQSSDININEERNPAFLLKRGASLSDIVKAINQIGVGPGDLVAILQALKMAGALNAELEII
jgi:flagellar P-ring protein FlgI